MSSDIRDLREGDMVCFELQSVYLPAVPVVLAELTGADQLIGAIMYFSDSDFRPRAFAVISLPGRSNVVVPVEKLARVCTDPPGPDSDSAMTRH